MAPARSDRRGGGEDCSGGGRPRAYGYVPPRGPGGDPERGVGQLGGRLGRPAAARSALSSSTPGARWASFFLSFHRPSRARERDGPPGPRASGKKNKSQARSGRSASRTMVEKQTRGAQTRSRRHSTALFAPRAAAALHSCSPPPSAHRLPADARRKQGRKGGISR